MASTTLGDPPWADTTVLSGALGAAIGELKARPAGELQVPGSGRLVRWLFEHGLVDELTCSALRWSWARAGGGSPHRPRPGA